jgi:aquaporin Z
VAAQDLDCLLRRRHRRGDDRQQRAGSGEETHRAEIICFQLQLAQRARLCYINPPMKTFRPCVAEFLGTFYLCFAGIAAILCNTPEVGGMSGLLGIALAHGLALSIAVNVFGGESGAHFNPAVTAGFLVTGRIAPPLAAAYVVAQLAGATTAAGVCRAIFPVASVNATTLGLPLPAAWATTGVVLLAEFVMTYLLMTSIFGTAVDERGRTVKIGGFGIGLTVAFDILAGGAVTGASMNPARSFGPALEMMHWQYHWMYWVAPIAGACAGALVYEHLLLRPMLPAVDEPRAMKR